VTDPGFKYEHRTLVVAELSERGWLSSGHITPPRGIAGRFIRRPTDLPSLPLEVPS